MTFLSNITSYKIEATRIMQASYISRKLLIVRHHSYLFSLQSFAGRDFAKGYQAALPLDRSYCQ